MTSANDLPIQRTLEATGVEFIDENGGGCAAAPATAIGMGLGETRIKFDHAEGLGGRKVRVRRTAIKTSSSMD